VEYAFPANLSPSPIIYQSNYSTPSKTLSRCHRPQYLTFVMGPSFIFPANYTEQKWRTVLLTTNQYTVGQRSNGVILAYFIMTYYEVEAKWRPRPPSNTQIEVHCKVPALARTPSSYLFISSICLINLRDLWMNPSWILSNVVNAGKDNRPTRKEEK
jgi:hypothetical protein